MNDPTEVDLDWHDVVSSNVRRVAYEDGDVCVEFRNGGTYRYVGVPEDEFLGLVEAPSPGRYLRHRLVGRYETKRLS